MTETAREHAGHAGQSARRSVVSPTRYQHGDELGGSHAELLELQRKAGNAAVAGLVDGESAADSVRRTISSGGRPLDAGVRTRMEEAFQTDFGSVRLHTGPVADQSAAAVGAHAYTAGENVAFASGSYAPGSSAGDHVIAHELAHVVQQRSGPVAGTSVGGGMSVSSPGDHDERSADAAADSALQRLRD